MCAQVTQGLVKNAHPDSVGLPWGLGFCGNKLPGDADMDGPETHLRSKVVADLSRKLKMMSSIWKR